MASINLDPGLEQWLEQSVFRLFAQQGIEVTAAAKNVICYTVQAQTEEQTPPHLERELARLQSNMKVRSTAQGTYFEDAVGVFLEIYPPNTVLSVNRAIRLMAELYFRRFGGFPCGPTGGKQSGSGSGQSGSGTKTKIGQGEPATAGA